MPNNMKKTITEEELRYYGGEIFESVNFRRTAGHIQHGTVSVQEHCKEVARTSLRASRKLRLGCRERELVRGALLHDYFLYDWHVGAPAKWSNLHGFHHPRIALLNAMKEYKLTKREQDIIRKHMWPLTVKPPLCREAWLVTLVDKYCALKEAVKMRRRSGKNA